MQVSVANHMTKGTCCLTDVTGLVVEGTSVGRGGEHGDPRIALTEIHDGRQAYVYLTGRMRLT